MYINYYESIEQGILPKQGFPAICLSSVSKEMWDFRKPRKQVRG